MKKSIIITVVFLMLIVTSACSTLKTKQGSSPEHITAASSPQPSNVSYDFKDILVPNSMKLINDDSIVIETGNMKTGLICFKGRVDPVSLFDFFVTSMASNGWHLRSYFKYRRYILIYEKSDRDCVIRITSGFWGTKLELWVTPRHAGSEVVIQ
jgi:hypothetical protein